MTEKTPIPSIITYLHHIDRQTHIDAVTWMHMYTTNRQTYASSHVMQEKKKNHRGILLVV